MEQDHMQRELPPPSYAQSHDPKSLEFPSVPKADPPSIHHDRVLPPLPTILPEPRPRAEEPPFVWPSSNPLAAYYQPGPSQLSPKGAKPSNGLSSPTAMDLDSSDGRGRRGGSVVSMDDPDVRMAAEALGDLRADFVQSPPLQQRSLHRSSPGVEGSRPEPLLSLLTTSHPLIGSTINTSLSAYSASKNYSPRFKSSAEYVEKRFTPVVNTVGSVGRFTGVEGGVRWFLRGRRPSHHAPSDSEPGADSVNYKRRKMGARGADKNEDRNDTSFDTQELPHRQRAPSRASTIESLPAYDDQRSPSYEATQNALVSTRQIDDAVSPGGSTWQSRLVLSTSGLSVAMSEESLRSLKYCLNWLRWANEHIGKVIHALKAVLEEFEQGSNGSIENGVSNDQQLVVRSDAERTALNAKINALKKDVLKTLKDVVDIVSKYAGGALPENARILVRKHLTSLPQRFRLANTRIENGQSKNGEKGDAEIMDGANRVLVLAKEGLDMMAQVSGVLDGTIVSAEEWCEKLGRTKRDEAAVEATGTSKEKEGGKLPMEYPPMRTNEFEHAPDIKMG